LFLRIGPPSVPPYWFRLKGGTLTAKKLRALSFSFLRNSKSEAWS